MQGRRLWVRVLLYSLLICIAEAGDLWGPAFPRNCHLGDQAVLGAAEPGAGQLRDALLRFASRIQVCFE